MSKVHKIESWQYFFTWKKNIATAFVFYCDAKHSDNLRSSSHVRCYLFLDSCGQKLVQPFGSRNSKICFIYLNNELMKWADFLNAVTNLGKLNVNLIIIGSVSSKMGGPFRSWDCKIRCISQMIWKSTRLIEWFLHADSNWIIFGLTANLLISLTFAGCPLQFYLLKMIFCF